MNHYKYWSGFSPCISNPTRLMMASGTGRNRLCAVAGATRNRNSIHKMEGLSMRFFVPLKANKPVECPQCGFIARKLCSDGHTVKYICQRCQVIFVP